MPPSHCEPATVAVPTILPLVVEIQQSGPEGEEAAETSGRGRRKRAPRRIGDLNGCLCGLVVNPGVDSNMAIKCRQPGCETQWVCSTDYSWVYEDLTNNLHIVQYHLNCVGLEQPPTKWVCEACEASGQVRASARASDVILPYLDSCLIT